MQTKRRSTYERIVWEEGMVQGRDEGRLEGRVEGRVEGRRMAAVELVIELLGERFGGCDERLRERLGAIQDESRLRQLARAVLSVRTLEEFEARLEG